jgi:hypothetical protein
MNIQKCFTNISSFFHLSIFTAFLLAQNSTVLAATIPAKIVENNLLDFKVTWEGSGLDDGDSNDSLVAPALEYWQIGPTNPITLNYQGGGYGWQGFLTVQHTAAPHAGEGPGNAVLFNINFDQMSDTNSVLNESIAHGSHTDLYTFTYSYDVGKTDRFSATLTGVHVVPIPAAIWLFGSALIGFIGLGKKRLTRVRMPA